MLSGGVSPALQHLQRLQRLQHLQHNNSLSHIRRFFLWLTEILKAASGGVNLHISETVSDSSSLCYAVPPYLVPFITNLYFTHIMNVVG